MIKRIVRMSFHEQHTETFKKIYEANWQYIKNVEGCRHVELLQDRTNASLFFTFSIWESEQHLNAYRDSALFGRVWSATKILFNDKPQAWSLNEIDFNH